MSDEMTFCVHCGPNVKIDDDGTCSSCGSDAYGKGIEYIERLRAELDDATKWNHSVRVCKDHTADIVDGECVICELAEKDKRIEELERRRDNYYTVRGALDGEEVMSDV